MQVGKIRGVFSGGEAACRDALLEHALAHLSGLLEPFQTRNASAAEKYDQLVKTEQLPPSRQEHHPPHQHPAPGAPKLPQLSPGAGRVKRAGRRIFLILEKIAALSPKRSKPNYFNKIR
jgi:hypothetical protein